MMMTCRLLCALLVLALCCCPSVFATEAKYALKDERDISEEGSDLEDNQMEEPKQVTELPIKASSSPETKKEKEGTEHAGNTALHSPQAMGSMQETAEPQSNPNNTQEEDDGKSTEERTENTNADKANEQNEKPNAMNETTTTTTTMAPTTTSTTAAPEAPSTTTTEVPTTTTTRAPSRLREIDGSLSSSAWVCAPLLLAASALSYTTLG
ncbi:mucin TcMUCII [Trypanosoma cruzi cruzi]|uniref:Putative mucin TcMUCII n=1 Tax=Trypanosoma cruzi TaxID=5693 RepID=A0A2V2W6L7_TRYCR|nr:mucin TcMUCII [Trypanosoma cruzi cruzi]PWV03333.1 putative mucin TcMUCII [Trypanosoma cruzi]